MKLLLLAPCAALLAACSGETSASATPNVVPAVLIPADARSVTLAVEGMHCGGCAEGVREALAGCPGVYAVAVDFEKKIARLDVAPTCDVQALTTVGDERITMTLVQ